MGKSSSAVKRMLRKKWEDVCNAYVLELLNNWDLDGASYGYWIADEIGGTYAYGDYITINMDEIVYCVENDIQEKEYVENQEYNVRANEFGFNLINLQSWHKGVPRVPDETFNRLEKMKQDLDDAIKQEKENQKKGKPQNPF